MGKHSWDDIEVLYCVDRVFETFVINRQYDYDELLDELYIHFEMQIKKSSLKMFLSNMKYLFNEYKIPNTLMISPLKNASLTAKAAFNIALEKYNIKNKN